MNKRDHIATLIETNRIAILRMVFCWLSAAMCLNVRGDGRLPRRIAAFVSGLIWALEKATGYLLIAIFHHAQKIRRPASEFEKAVDCLIASNGAITLRALTAAGIIQRLKALQHILHNLHAVAQLLAKSIAAQARVSAMAVAGMNAHEDQFILLANSMCALEDAVPP